MSKFFLLFYLLINNTLCYIPIYNEEDFSTILTQNDIVLASICFNRCEFPSFYDKELSILKEKFHKHDIKVNFIKMNLDIDNYIYERFHNEIRIERSNLFLIRYNERHLDVYNGEKNIFSILNWIKPQIGVNVLEITSDYQFSNLEKVKFLLIYLGNTNDKLYQLFIKAGFTFSTDPTVLVVRSKDTQMMRLFDVDRKKVNSGENYIFIYYKTLNYKSKIDETTIKSYTEIVEFVNSHKSMFDFTSNRN